MPDNETVTRPAAGRVRTGFSNVFVALYHIADGVVTYTNCIKLGRARNINVSATVAEGNDYYADDDVAEVGNNRFVKGTADVTVDGAWTEVRRLVYGLLRTKSITVGQETVSLTPYGTDQKLPYMGIGWVEDYQSAGEEFHVAKMLRKVRFKQSDSEEANTREEQISWQDETMKMDVMRDGSTENDFKYESEELDSKSLAIAVVEQLLGKTA